MRWLLEWFGHRRSIDAKLDAMDAKLDAISERLHNMPSQAEFNTLIDAFNAETNAIAAELTALRDVIAAGPQISQENFDKLTAISARLTVLASDPANPVPSANGIATSP